MLKILKELLAIFGIHVKRDKQCEVINRGCPKDITRLAYGSAEIRGNK